jgi:hypothetical protein
MAVIAQQNLQGLQIPTTKEGVHPAVEHELFVKTHGDSFAVELAN